MKDFEKMQRCPHCGKVIARDRYLTINQVVDMTGASYQTIYRNRVELGGVKRLGRWKFAAGKVESFMKVNE